MYLVVHVSECERGHACLLVYLPESSMPCLFSFSGSNCFACMHIQSHVRLSQSIRLSLHSGQKMSIVYDQHVFHYVVDSSGGSQGQPSSSSSSSSPSSLIYLCMVDDAENKRRLAFLFLEEIQRRFMSTFGEAAYTVRTLPPSLPPFLPSSLPPVPRPSLIPETGPSLPPSRA